MLFLWVLSLASTTLTRTKNRYCSTPAIKPPLSLSLTLSLVCCGKSSMSMGVLNVLRLDHLQRLSTATAFTILVLFTSASTSASAITLTPPVPQTGLSLYILFFLVVLRGSSNQCSVLTKPFIQHLGTAGDPHQQQQQQRKGVDTVKQLGGVHAIMVLGSSPPMCKTKCGHCSPCKAVHVAVHPGISVPLEYYPEAWRCKCGNKLFMP